MFKIIVSIVFLFTLGNSEIKILSKKNINKWLTYYYLNPQPKFTMDAIKIFSEQKALLRQKSLAPIGAFLSRVFEKNPDLVNNYINEFTRYSEQERKVFIFAIYYSNIHDKFYYIEKLSKTEKEKLMLQRMKTMKFMKIVDMNVISPITLDQHWGGFMASGDEVHIYRIIQALEYVDSKDGRKIMTGSAAKWSLISNAVQHKKVLEICKNAQKEVPDYLKKILNDVVSSAEEKLKNPGTGYLIIKTNAFFLINT